MTAPMTTSPEAADPALVGHRLRVAIKMLAAGEGMTIPELGRRAGVGGQHLSDRIEENRKRPPTRLSIEETAAVAGVLGLTLTALVQVAETGEGIPLRRKASLTVIEGGKHTTTHPSQPPLLSVVE